MPGPNGVVGMLVHAADATTAGDHQRYYFHHDHLGSIATITQEIAAAPLTSQVVAHYTYDAWGRRSKWTGSWAATTEENLTERGFTYHEMLDHLGLIHMNGRIYDPLLGRFLSADPTLQFPSNFQNYNRYSYVGNNPLSITDPTGYNWLRSFAKQFWRPILAIVLTIVTAGAFLALVYPALGGLMGGMSAFFSAAAGTLSGISATAAILAGAIGGFVGGLVATGTLKGAAFGALSGAVAAGIGQAFHGAWAGSLGDFKGLVQAMAHGVSQGAIADVQGGRFSSGFYAGAFSSLAASYGPMNGEGFTPELLQATVAGGTGSVIGGDKFENGAVTGAFVFLFNDAMSPDKDKSRLFIIDVNEPMSTTHGLEPTGVGIDTFEQTATELKADIAYCDNTTNKKSLKTVFKQVTKKYDEVYLCGHGSIPYHRGTVLQADLTFNVLEYQNTIFTMGGKSVTDITGIQNILSSNGLVVITGCSVGLNQNLSSRFHKQSNSNLRVALKTVTWGGYDPMILDLATPFWKKYEKK